METVSALASAASQTPILTFLILYLGVILLGNVSVFVGFWIVLTGNFGPWGIPAYLGTILLANVSGDLLWYTLGKNLREHRLGGWLIKKVPNHDRLEAHLHKRGARWVLMSKFVYASTAPLIFALGWARIPFRTFFRASLLSIVMWIPLLSAISLALISGVLSPLRGVALFKKFELALLIAVIAFIAVNYGLGTILRTRFKTWFRREDESS